MKPMPRVPVAWAANPYNTIYLAQATDMQTSAHYLWAKKMSYLAQHLC